MANISIIPHDWMGGNNLFDNSKNEKSQRFERFQKLKEMLEKQGHACHTTDMFTPADIDVLIFHDLHHELAEVLRVLKGNPGVRLVYTPNEPVVISPLHHPDTLVQLPFDLILTWNDDIAGKYERVVKCNIGQPVINVAEVPDIPYPERKFIAAIYSNKSSQAAGALYEERLQAIEFFADKPEGMDLYGMGWGESRLPYIHSVFKGPCKSKREVLKHYKFSIAFENVKGLSGLITEKIFDCFDAGTVPIYLGAPNIRNYIPESTFVDFAKFGNYQALYEYLSNMPEKIHRGYLDAAHEFLHSPAYYPFTSSCYAETLTANISRIMAMPKPNRSLASFKVQIMKQVISNPNIFTEFRKFRRLLMDMAVAW